jgi:hypothetical protein
MGENSMSRQFTISEDQLERILGVERLQPTVRCGWLEDVARQFRAIANLSHGWDSYGSPPPDTRKLDAAWDLLTCLCQGSDLSKPHVNPTPDGGVQFDWEEGRRYFEIVLVAERAATYLFRDDDAGVEETGEVFEVESLNHLLDYVHRVALGPQKAFPIPSTSFVECGRYVEVVR